MDEPVAARDSAAPRHPRRSILLGLVAGAGSVALGGMPEAARAAAPGAACGEGVLDVLNLALAAEHLATTLYYNGLTTRAIVDDKAIAGSRGSPAYAAGRVNLAYLQAALAQEQQHATLLADAGGSSPYTHFYFPAGTFERLGHTREPGTFLWVVDHLETAFIGAYLAAIQRFGALKRTDLALLATRILGIECEHRLLYRTVAGDLPANNLTLEVRSFTCVGDALRVLTPFLTGRGFSGSATPALSLPTATQTTLAITTSGSG